LCIDLFVLALDAYCVLPMRSRIAGRILGRSAKRGIPASLRVCFYRELQGS
jgi:hypothetical protein